MPEASDDYHAILARWHDPEGPISAGTTSRGSLQGAAELDPDGAHHTIIDRARPRGTRFGHPTMITLITDAAERVAQDHPGAILAIGNIGYKEGGDIRWSVSHNSGRDADLAFYVRDAATGDPMAAAPDLIEFRDDGTAIGREDLVFDVPRNWSLARALLTHETAQIQYLFISKGLKAKLLAHARAIGEPAELIAAASEVLKQPTDSLPHNDHFHLRITCDLRDRLRGCVDRGPRWEWVDWHEDELLAQTMAMIPALRDPDPEVRHDALEYIHAIDSPYGTEFALFFGATSEDPDVRDHALDVASRFWTFTGAAHVAMQQTIDSPRTTLDERASLYAMMRRSHNRWTIDFVKDRLRDDAVQTAEKAWAARALAHHMEPELVPFLLDQLVHQPREVRVELAMVLRRIANRAEAIDWEVAGKEDVLAAHRKWTAWWETHRGQEREVWLAQGFATIGVEPAYYTAPSAIEPMLAALPDAPDHLAYNINRTLREVTGRWSSLEQRDADKLHAHWSEWWSDNREEWLQSS